MVAASESETFGTLPVVPEPVKCERLKGCFTLKPQTKVFYSRSDEAAKNAACFFCEVINPATGYLYRPEEKPHGRTCRGAVVFATLPNSCGLGEEGYRLRVTPEGISVSAPTEAGLFYGIQTLRQLLPPEITKKEPVRSVSWNVPACKIEDFPRFRWRGALVDVARHFFSLSELKDFIDWIAFYKLNRLQLHLSDDQGWRIEIKRYPKLTKVGSVRAESPLRGNRTRGDGKPYGPYFFTQEEIRALVLYASKRHVTLVPEIEMPAHCRAALASYPELGCTGGPYEVATRWGGNVDLFCPGKESTFAFMQGVLSEVAGVFPGPYIHIGGDEADMRRWKVCPHCRRRMEREDLTKLEELHSYFIRRVEKIVNSLGRTLVGWDEILQGGLPPRAVVMSWRGVRGGIAAVKAGHQAVMCPTSHCYFDYYQSQDRSNEPEAIGGFIPLEKVYAFRPVPAGLSAQEAGRILGGQGNLWTEFIFDYAQLQYMAFPRLCALSEVLWSPGEGRRDFPAFKARLRRALQHMKAAGASFRPLNR